MPQGEYAGFPCEHPRCSRISVAHGYCGAHYMRMKRGQDMNAPIREHRPLTKRQRLEEAAFALAEAEGDGDYADAWRALRRAAIRYASGEAEEAPKTH